MAAAPVRLRAVLFDAAGTLVLTRESVGSTYARHFEAFGSRLPAQRIDEAFRRVLRGMPPMAFPDAPAAEIPALERAWWREIVRRTLRAADGTARLRDPDACFDEIFAHYARAAAWQVAPGAEVALGELGRRGLRLAVVSNFDTRLEGILAGLELSHHFERIILPAEARIAKPDPRIFAFALEALGVPASAAAYVGDDPTDDHASARAAGLRAVDVRALATLEALPRLLDRSEPDA